MKTNLDHLYKTSQSVEKNGVWFEIFDGVMFRVKRFGGSNGREMQKVIEKYSRPYAKMIEKGTLPDEKDREIFVRAFVEGCVCDWKGIIIDDKEAPYDSEVAIKFFLSLPDLLTEIVTMSQKIEYYREDVGNSSTIGSSGN